MQTSSITKLVFIILVGTVLSLPCQSFSQATQRAKGALANGIYGEIDVNRNTNKSPEIIVSVIDSKADQIFGEGHLGTNWLKAFGSENWRYFEATNSFCGPIELEDANGQSIPLIEPALSLPEAYPKTYSLSEEWKRHFPPNPHAYSLDAETFPLPIVRTVSVLAKFPLQDYFDVKQPGQYQLTVWPKIYERSATNSDICERIDLPPVSANIKLDAIEK